MAGAGRADLRRQIQFPKAENEVLRARIEGPIRVTAKEQYGSSGWLGRWGRPSRTS